MDMLSTLKSSLDKLDRKAFPHGSNLRTKLHSSSLSSSQVSAIKNLAPTYLSIIKSSTADTGDLHNWLRKYTLLIDEHMELLRSTTRQEFSHQSDLVSSVLPEYLCSILRRVVKDQEMSLEVEGQTDIMIDLAFSHGEYGRLFIKFKRVDAAVLIPVKLTFQGKDVSQFKIPLVAAEVKTNLDKNMIAGIDSSVSALKSTFPLCRYFVISEFADFQFENQNYANTDIDEVYILRKQKRGEFRRTGKINSISLDVVNEFLRKVEESISVIKRSIPDIAQRMSKGRLINWRVA